MAELIEPTPPPPFLFGTIFLDILRYNVVKYV